MLGGVAYSTKTQAKQAEEEDWYSKSPASYLEGVEGVEVVQAVVQSERSQLGQEEEEAVVVVVVQVAEGLFDQSLVEVGARVVVVLLYHTYQSGSLYLYSPLKILNSYLLPVLVDLWMVTLVEVALLMALVGLYLSEEVAH